MSEAVEFDERCHFDDPATGGPASALARSADIKGRCANCWGPAVGSKDGERWIRIQCSLCRQSVHGEAADREVESMQLEANTNMRWARGGRGLTYRHDARFVLKILPDMDRDTTWFDQRVAARQAQKPKRGWMGRHEFPPGTAGNLYAQARLFLSAVENLAHDMSVIALSDFDFGKPRIVGIDTSMPDASVRVDAAIPLRQRKPSGPEQSARMGTAMVAGMVASFACELAIKAILMTRLDEAKKTHDLFELYEALPKDSRDRLQADFPRIAGVLLKHRHTFGKWRYFEKQISKKAILALVHTERVRDLGKAARVIIDECVVAGLAYEIYVNSTFDITADQGGMTNSERVKVTLDAGEAAIAWYQIVGGSPGSRVAPPWAARRKAMAPHAGSCSQ